MASWRSSKARPETLRMAEAMSRTGFDRRTGQQVRPKAASVIAQDAGASVSSAERFLAKARAQGRLTPTGERISLSKGKQATPMYVLTVPGPRHGAPFVESVPRTLRPELSALVALFTDERPIAEPPWARVNHSWPAWAAEGYGEAA